MNMPALMEGVIKFVTSFAKDKMKTRMHVHSKGDWSKLHEEVGKDVLPEEFGGTNGKLQDHIGNKYIITIHKNKGYFRIPASE